MGSAATSWPSFDPGDAPAKLIHQADQVPSRSEGQPGGLGVDALAHHDVGQGDSCGEHLHPHFAGLRLRARLLHHPKVLGPAVVGDDNASVGHGPFLHRRARAVPGVPRLPRGDGRSEIGGWRLESHGHRQETDGPRLEMEIGDWSGTTGTGVRPASSAGYLSGCWCRTKPAPLPGSALLRRGRSGTRCNGVRAQVLWADGTPTRTGATTTPPPPTLLACSKRRLLPLHLSGAPRSPFGHAIPPRTGKPFGPKVSSARIASHCVTARRGRRPHRSGACSY